MRQAVLGCHFKKGARVVVRDQQVALIIEPEGAAAGPLVDVITPPVAPDDDGGLAAAPDLSSEAVRPALEEARVVLRRDRHSVEPAQALATEHESVRPDMRIRELRKHADD